MIFWPHAASLRTECRDPTQGWHLHRSQDGTALTSAITISTKHTKQHTQHSAEHQGGAPGIVNVYIFLNWPGPCMAFKASYVNYMETIELLIIFKKSHCRCSELTSLPRLFFTTRARGWDARTLNKYPEPCSGYVAGQIWLIFMKCQKSKLIILYSRN